MRWKKATTIFDLLNDHQILYTWNWEFSFKSRRFKSAMYFFLFFFVESSLLTRHDFILFTYINVSSFYAKYIACIEISCICSTNVYHNHTLISIRAISNCFHFPPCYVDDNTTTTILKYCNFSNKKINNIIKKLKCAFSTEATNLDGSE